MAGKAALVDQIKSIQKKSPEDKQAWWDYCEANLGGIKDPNRHDLDVLEEFVAAYDSSGLSGGAPARGAPRGGAPRGGAPRGGAPRGVAPSRSVGGGVYGGGSAYGGSPAFGGCFGGKGGGAYGMSMPMMPDPMWAMSMPWASPAAGGSGSEMAEFVKAGQRKSPKWKLAWQAYCQTFGNGFNDPAKYQESFVVDFINYVGDLVVQDLGVTEDLGAPPVASKRGASYSAETPAKRMALGAGSLAAKGKPPRSAGAAASAGGDSEKTELVDKIKVLQRSDPEAKNAWWEFCDENHEGIKDPNRHEKESLREFLSSYEEV